MFCKGCGKQIKDSTVFCPYCGTKQDVVSRNDASPEGSTQAGGFTSSRNNASRNQGRGFIKKSLDPDEKVIMQVELGWCCIVPNIIVGAIILIFFIQMSRMMRAIYYYSYYMYGSRGLRGGGYLIIGIIICAVIILLGVLRKMSWELGVTDKRVIKKNGIIRIRSMDIPLDKINTVVLNRGLFGRMLGMGSMTIVTSSLYRLRLGVAGGIGIKKAGEFRTCLVDQMEQFKKDEMQQQAEAIAQAIK